MTDIILIMLKLLFWITMMSICFVGLGVMIFHSIPKETRLALLIGVLSLSNIAWYEVGNIGRHLDCEYNKVCK